MNKYKFGDKVYIKSSNIYGEVIGWTQRNINGKDCGYTYTIKVKLYGSFIWYATDVPENDIEKFIKVKFENGKSIQVYDNDKSAYNCDCGSEQHSCTEKCDEKDYEYNKSCESLDNDKKFNLGDLATSPTYPEIEDYYYDENTATTVIKWSDNTTTKVKASANDTPNQYAGFAFAVAKKYFGNGNKSMKEAHWFIDVCPEMDKELDRAFAEYVQDEERKKAKREAKREKRIIKTKALARKREYEARKLATEKYGVPMDWNEDGE